VFGRPGWSREWAEKRDPGGEAEVLGELPFLFSTAPRGVPTEPSSTTRARFPSSRALGQGRPRRAIADFDRALAINPQDADAFLNRGSARIEKGDLEVALAKWPLRKEVEDALRAARETRGK